MSPDLFITSFGFGHRDERGVLLPPPQADFVFDVSNRFRDPHIDPELRALTGLDDAVYRKVKTTPGVKPFLQELSAFLVNLVDEQTMTPPLTLAFGCVGGRHRSVALARLLDGMLDEYGWTVSVTHRDVHKPVIVRADRESK